MTILHGYPLGMLAMLGSQNFGETPKELGQVVVPTVNLQDNYLLSWQDSVSGAAAPVAIGFAEALVVPDGFVWRLHACSGLIVHGAGVTADYAVIVKPNNGAAVGITGTAAVAANQTRIISMTCSPLWLTAGTRIGLQIASLVGVPASVAVSAIVSRIRA